MAVQNKPHYVNGIYGRPVDMHDTLTTYTQNSLKTTNIHKNVLKTNIINTHAHIYRPVHTDMKTMYYTEWGFNKKHTLLVDLVAYKASLIIIFTRITTASS